MGLGLGELERVENPRLRMGAAGASSGGRCVFSAHGEPVEPPLGLSLGSSANMVYAGPSTGSGRTGGGVFSFGGVLDFSLRFQVSPEHRFGGVGAGF